MVRFLLRRLLLFPAVLLLANFFGYAYAFYLIPIQFSRSPYALLQAETPAVFPEYFNYLARAAQLDFGSMHTGEPILTQVLRTGVNSLGLLAISLALSVVVGLALGLQSVRNSPPRTASWLTILSTVGLASPSFYIGILFITASILYLFYGPSNKPLLPFQGFGWDNHLVLPVLALMVRPTVQLAQLTSGMLVGELEKQYVTAARSFGFSVNAIRTRVAFRNILAPVALAVAGSLRLLVAELIIIERLFDWPGFGRLLSSTLVLTSHSNNFLDPPLLAALLAVLVGLFLLADLIASLLARSIDPRLRQI